MPQPVSLRLSALQLMIVEQRRHQLQQMISRARYALQVAHSLRTVYILAEQVDETGNRRRENRQQSQHRNSHDHGTSRTDSLAHSRSLLRLEPFAIQFAKYFSFDSHPHGIRSDGGRNLIGRRTESDRTANGIRSDGGRNLIGRRTQSDRTADANGEKSLGCVSLEMSVEPKINPEVHFYWASGRIFMLFAVLPDSNN